MAETPPRRFTGHADAMAWIEQHFAGWTQDLTVVEREALVDYKGVGYRKLNHALRAEDLSEAQAEQVRAIDLALARAPLPEAVVVYRAVVATGLGYALDYLEGAQITDDAFLSTTLIVAIAENFLSDADEEDAVLAEITVTAGTPVGPLDLVQSASEAELLLPRQTQLRVQKVMPARGTNFYPRLLLE